MAGDREAWRTIQAVRGGGQGRTFKVRHRATGEIGFLKELTRPRDTKARKRCYREVSAYRTVTHPRIPRLLDDNSAEYANNDIDLYLVTEFVEGDSLRGVISADSSRTIEDCLRFGLHIVEAVGACHEADVTHRDLKPKNVMLRGGDLTDPVLVDFGLSFNQVDDLVDDVTRIEEIGNRFLRLPEHSAGGLNQRDPRSDLAHVAALILYSLTGVFPRNLIDEEGRLPHQRDPIRDSLRSLSVPPCVLRVFDTAFQQEISRRYQSHKGLGADLLRCLERLADDGEPDSELAILERVRESARNPNAERDAVREEHLQNALNVIRGVHVELTRELGSGFTTSQGGFQISGADSRGRNTLGFARRGAPDDAVKIKFDVRVVGVEVVVSVYGEDPFYRGECGSDDLNSGLAQATRSVFLQALDENFGSGRR